MKPEAWQIREAIDNACKRPENRPIFKMSLEDFLREIGLVMLDDLIKTIS